MRNCYRGIAWSLSLALVLCWAASSHAAIVSYNGPVVGTKTPGGELIFGTGNQNRGFTVDQNSALHLELGLRAHSRFPADDSQSVSPTPGLMNQGNGVYGSFEPQGYFSNGTLGGTRASWSFDFSINTSYDNLGTTLGGSGLTFVLSIDYDPSFGTNFLSLNALTGRPDNEYGFNTAYGDKAGDNLPAPGDNATDIATYNVAQNSQQLNFFAGPQPFNPNVSGDYIIRLQAFRGDPLNDGVLVGQSQIEVIVGTVPEPASMAIWGLGALGCAVAGYRRRKLAA